MARLENHRLLRPGASFLLPAPMSAFRGAGHRRRQSRECPGGYYVARVLCVLLGLMAAEILITLLLEIYRPRREGKSFPAGLRQPDCRIARAAGEPVHDGGAGDGLPVRLQCFRNLVLSTVAKKPARLLLLAQLAVLLLSTCVVFVDAGEQAVLERFGKPVAGGVLHAGRTFQTAVAGGQDLSLPHGADPDV